MNDPVITASDLAKSFRGGVIAVNGLDLTVPRGAVYGLIGRNGAGKTTTLRMLMEEIVGFLGDGGERTVLFSTHRRAAICRCRWRPNMGFSSTRRHECRRSLWVRHLRLSFPS